MPFDATPHPESAESAYEAVIAARRARILAVEAYKRTPRTLDDIDREMAASGLLSKASHVGLATMSGNEGPSLVTIAHSYPRGR